jgi:glycosyltransferase involved in cell wall biosynthesis
MLGYASFALFSLPAMFRCRRPDVVIVESPPLLTAVPAMLHQVIRRRPIVLLAADLWPDVAVDMGLISPGVLLSSLRWLEKVTYRRSWKISAVTRAQIDTLTQDKHVSADKVVFLPNGVDATLFAPGEPTPEAERLLRPHGERVILYAGTHGHAHGMDVLLDAAPLVHARHPDVSFVCVGGGSERERMMARAAAEGLTYVRFLEPRPIEEIADLYRASWAGISTLRPSRSLEMARPSKVFPIMASARPVIYSGNGEGSRLIEEAGAGVTAPGGDHVALADVITELLDDPERAAQLGANGRAYVLAHLTWSALLSSWLAQLGSTDG